MRSSIFIVAASAAFAAAQSISSLPKCGQTCITNMLAIAQSQFGCAQGNATCYCTNVDFGYGVRDCAIQYCQNSQYSDETIAFGEAYCKKVLSGGGSGSGGSSTATGATGASASPTGSGTATGTAGGAGGKGGSIAITTEALTTDISTAGSVVTSTTGSTTIYATSGQTETFYGVFTSGGSTFSSATETTVVGVGAAGKKTKTTLTNVSTQTNSNGMPTNTKTGKATKQTTVGVQSSSGGGSGSSGQTTSSSSSSGIGAPLATMAPGLLGAAALAILAL